MFDFSQLRCFAAVAEELHFGRAAARLNMTQPPLSRQIQVLERVLDVQLLERTSRTVRLTAAGRSFLPEAQRILRLAETATHVTRQVAAGRAGVLKFGFTAASAYDFLPRLVTAFRRALPDVTLALREMVSKDQIEELLAGRIDAALVRPPVTHPDLIAVRALAEPLVVALPAGNPLALRDGLTPADLGREPLIGYAPNEARYFHDLVLGLLAEAEIRPPMVQQLTQIHSILALVRASLGIALVPAAAERLRFEGVVFRPLALPAPRPVELLLAWRRDADDPLIAQLVSIVAEMPPA
ncbi:DNA-binding transcriptional LysR family regulator [Methylobacterium sp. PvP062]|jgi:DNA-binding transcriptional LysR family regulator|uniref:Transcriptional regulator, LysR family n=2 Tax=Methylobacterium radiotolerans TaxID=31998 RepID=B1M7P5_METRJ|nr:MULTISPECIES: LysR family transcriptional regulator [Methylobacterium]MBE7247887.1 LysR family transcriptional regulator [Actinomycetospora chiangmaiensis]MCX7331521.1 LysR family transcriptional regulator [Hyphomicrobiales bacterium]GAN51275.1 LysR family transcriptional regulator [Methylobacterium sp. ME121]ACB23770.1 transcriptional regulator, LysR family [Methylobacterium radiotolerans JCM 2831]KIU35570.1 LysR family transcriptional regulator [Methylobacterium radiotolerans]